MTPRRHVDLAAGFEAVLSCIRPGERVSVTARQLALEVERRGYHKVVEIEPRPTQRQPELYWSRSLGLLAPDADAGYAVADLVALDWVDALPSDAAPLHAAHTTSCSPPLLLAHVERRVST